MCVLFARHRYLDVVNRLDPVVVALEMEDRPVIIVSHQVYGVLLYVPLRCFMSLPWVAGEGGGGD